jgi:hypothetical protein
VVPIAPPGARRSGRRAWSRRPTHLGRPPAEGKLKPAVGKVFPLAEAAQAHRFLEENTLGGAGSLVGQVLLAP